MNHPQTSSPGDPCQDDTFISGQQNYSSATLSHKDVLPDSLIKVGAQEINEVVSVSLLCFVAFELRTTICALNNNTFFLSFLRMINSKIFNSETKQFGCFSLGFYLTSLCIWSL